MVKLISNDTFWILLFLYYSFGVEKTNTFIRSRGSLENHTRFKTIMVKIYTRFQTKTAKKTIPFGAAHTYIAYIGSTLPARGPVVQRWCIRNQKVLGLTPVGRSRIVFFLSMLAIVSRLNQNTQFYSYYQC